MLLGKLNIFMLMIMWCIQTKKMKRLILFGFTLLFCFSLVIAAPHGFSDPASLSISDRTLFASDDAIYYQGWYSTNEADWVSFTFPDTQTSGWILDGDATKTLPDVFVQGSENYVLVYSCSKGSWSNNDWTCHGNQWQILQFDVINDECTIASDCPVIVCQDATCQIGSPNTCTYQQSQSCQDAPYSVPENFKVAFIADQGEGSDAAAVLQLIKDEGANMVLHQGDFDCNDNPDGWDDQITSILGYDYPLFASVGNHDLGSWSGYQNKLEERLARVDGAVCTGDLGVKSSCTYQGLFFVLSGIGTMGSDHEAYLANELPQSDKLWKVCSWHKNQRLMQVGGKSDEVGWTAFDTCRENGAIIAMGHEHSYSRTYAMSNYEYQTIHDTSSTVLLDEGVSFAVVSGIAGRGIRAGVDELEANPWWASVYTSDQGAVHGALFCTLHINGDPRAGECYLKNIQGQVIDQFSLRNEVNSNTVCSLPQNLNIMPLGDSITSAATNRDSYRRELYFMLQDAGYNFDFVGHHTTTNLHDDFDLDHSGQSGWRADELLNGPDEGGDSKLGTWLQTITPDAVLLHIGTNDCGHDQSFESTIVDIEGLIGALRADNPSVVIFLAKIIPRGGATTHIQCVDDLGPAIELLANQLSTTQSPIVVVNQYNGFNVATDTYDNLHPNEGGEVKMATKWFDAIDAFYSC